MTEYVRDPAAVLEVRLADVPGLAGVELIGPWFTLGDEDRLLFERATWLDLAYPDPPPPEFGDDVVEGFFTLALLDALWSQLMCFDPATTYTMNYGVDRVRFVAPVRTGQRLRLRLTVAEVRAKSGGYLVRMRCEVAVFGQERPGMVADWLVIVRPREGAAEIKGEGDGT